MQRYVFDFSKGDKEQKDMLGGIGRRRCPGAVAVWEGASERFTPFLAFPPEVRKIIYTTDEIVKIVLGCRSAKSAADRLVARIAGSLTAGHLRRSAGAVKMQRPVGRTILTAPSTATSFLKAGGTPPHRGCRHQTGARVPAGLVGGQCATKI